MGTLVGILVIVAFVAFIVIRAKKAGERYKNPGSPRPDVDRPPKDHETDTRQ